MGRRRNEEEGPEAAWLDAEAKRRRAAWEAERPQRRLAKRAARESQPLFRRVYALEMLLTLSAALPAAVISGGGGGSGPDSRIPPDATLSFSGEHPRDLQRLFRLLTDTVRRIEAFADSDPQEPLESEDIDRVLLTEFDGYTAEDAVALEPLFGSPEAVRRVRRAAKKRIQ
jgi:hypothetical protein